MYWYYTRRYRIWLGEFTKNNLAKQTVLPNETKKFITVVRLTQLMFTGHIQRGWAEKV